MAPTLVVRQCKEVGARAGKGQRVYAPSGDGKVATRVKMGAWIETRSGEDTVILFSFFHFFYPTTEGSRATQACCYSSNRWTTDFFCRRGQPSKGWLQPAFIYRNT
jgi:hypothetical protein